MIHICILLPAKSVSFILCILRIIYTHLLCIFIHRPHIFMRPYVFFIYPFLHCRIFHTDAAAPASMKQDYCISLIAVVIESAGAASMITYLIFPFSCKVCTHVFVKNTFYKCKTFVILCCQIQMVIVTSICPVTKIRSYLGQSK